MQWSEEHQCLCDYMGIPLSKREVRELLTALRAHLKRTPAQLARSANDVLEKKYPEMAENHRRNSESMK